MIDSGTSFDGYRIDEILGQGGMGVVYEATQTSLGRKVALKIMRADLARDPGFASRFAREGRLQASLEHPNVLDVYEVGDSPHGLFIAMRLIRGGTLAELIQSRELGAGETLRVMGQVADALDAAHAAGLVHRDVKPQNVLVDGDGTAYLADFGLTRGGDGTSTSASAQMLGTMAYVAPEVIHGSDPGAAADRYAFAAALFHCLTGDVVFPMGSDAAVLYAHAAQPPPSASERRPELPPEVDGVLAAGLAKEPAERPATARALVEATQAALGDRAAAIGPPLEVPDRAIVTAPTPLRPPPRQPQASPRRPTRAALATLVVGVGVGVGAATLLSGDGSAGATTAVPAVSPGTVALGSSLGEPDRVVGCGGEAPNPAGGTCAIAQAELPGQTVLIPSDGTINGWTVRGVVGEVALNVVRPRGDETIRISRSQWEVSSSEDPVRFGTTMAVEEGDLLALELGRGASVGIRETDGATTQTWLDPVGGLYGEPDSGPGSDLEAEILFRADFEAGGSIADLETLTGSEAAGLPNGTVRERQTVEVSQPQADLTVRLVEVGDRVALDSVSNGRREVRAYLPGLIPGGVPVDLEALPVEGSPELAVGVWWVNPNSGRSIYEGFQVTASQIKPVD